jgi:hypothetical protein
MEAVNNKPVKPVERTEGQDYTPYKFVHPQNQQEITDYYAGSVGGCAPVFRVLQEEKA